MLLEKAALPWLDSNARASESQEAEQLSDALLIVAE